MYCTITISMCQKIVLFYDDDCTRKAAYVDMLRSLSLSLSFFLSFSLSLSLSLSFFLSLSLSLSLSLCIVYYVVCIAINRTCLYLDKNYGLVMVGHYSVTLTAVTIPPLILDRRKHDLLTGLNPL